MKKLYLVIPLMTMLLLQSCATTKSVSNNDRTKIYNASYDKVFDTVVHTLSDLGYSIKKANGKHGIINTNYIHNSAFKALLTHNKRTKVNAIVESLDNKTRVRFTIGVQKKALLTGWTSANMSKSKAREYYQKLFSAISDHLN